MENSSKIFTSLLVLMLFTSYANGQARKISISEALELSYNNNEKIKRYSERVQQKVYEDKAAKGNFLPSINLLGGYTYLSEKPGSKYIST